MINFNPLALLDKTLPPSLREQNDATILLRARVLMAMCLMYLSSTISIAASIAILNLLGLITLWSAVLSSTVSSSVYLVTLIYFKRSANLFWSANLFMSTLFFATLAFVYATGGVHSPVMMILMCVCVCAFLMAGKYVGLFWSFMVGLVYVIFYMLDQNGIKTLQVVEDSLQDLLVFFSWLYAGVIIFGGMALFASLTRNLSNTLNQEREQLRVKATYDPLTGAYNRPFFHDRIMQYLAACQEPGRAFVFLDIELMISALLSREEEELYLQQAVQALQNRYPGRVEPARSGGMALMAIIQDVADREQAEEVVGSVYVALQSALDETMVAIVMGAVMVPSYSEMENEIIQTGRKATLEAKSLGKSFVIYTDEDRIKLEAWTPKNWARRRFSEVVAR